MFASFANSMQDVNSVYVRLFLTNMYWMKFSMAFEKPHSELSTRLGCGFLVWLKRKNRNAKRRQLLQPSPAFLLEESRSCRKESYQLHQCRSVTTYRLPHLWRSMELVQIWINIWNTSKLVISIRAWSQMLNNTRVETSHTSSLRQPIYDIECFPQNDNAR